MDEGRYGNYVYDQDRVTVTVDPFGKCADGDKAQEKCASISLKRDTFLCITAHALFFE